MILEQLISLYSFLEFRVWLTFGVEQNPPRGDDLLLGESSAGKICGNLSRKF